MNDLVISRVKNMCILFPSVVWIIKFNRAYLHHDFGKRKRKVKESA